MEETKETTKKTTAKKTTAKKTTTKKATTKPVAKTPSTPKKTTKKVTETTTPKKETVDTKAQVNIQEVDAFAAISLILGVASLITWLYPILGVSIAIPGLSMGIVTHETRRSNYSLLGIVMSLIGIILSIVKLFSI